MPCNNNSTITKRLAAFLRKPLTSLWLSYFIYWAGAAAIMPYISVYYESVHLKGSQIGLLSSIPYFLSMVSSIIFAFISDISKQHKLVLRLCAAGMIVVMFIFPSAGNFAALLPVVLMNAVINAPFNSIMDQSTLVSLDEPQNYGSIRVGGSIGWGIMALVTGLIVDHSSLGLKSIFYLNAIFLAIYLLNTFNLPDKEETNPDAQDRVSIKKVWQMLRQPGFMPFLLTTIIWGFCNSSILSFQFLHIKSLGGSSTLMGISLSISLVGEIIAFIFASRLQAKLGPRKMVLLAYIVLFSWLTGLYLIRDPNLIPIFQIFGGAGYAMVQSGSVAYVNRRAPKELGTTAQAIRGGFYSGLGIGTGTLLCGVIYEAAGSVILFRVMSYLAVAGFTYGLALYLNDRRKKAAALD
jgi:PPP family 3-phenylpropionic acid transporter